MASDAAELVGITRNPVPNGAVPGFIEAKGWRQIRYARWDTTGEQRANKSPLRRARRIRQKFFEPITDLRRRGFANATMDWRGQGGPTRLLRNPAKGHAEGFARHDDDVRKFMTEIVLPDFRRHIIASRTRWAAILCCVCLRPKAAGGIALSFRADDPFCWTPRNKFDPLCSERGR